LNSDPGQPVAVDPEKQAIFNSIVIATVTAEGAIRTIGGKRKARFCTRQRQRFQR